jgi:hypothetical protein
MGAIGFENFLMKERANIVLIKMSGNCGIALLLWYWGLTTDILVLVVVQLEAERRSGDKKIWTNFEKCTHE